MRQRGFRLCSITETPAARFPPGRPLRQLRLTIFKE